MSKYIDADLLRKEIESYRKECENSYGEPGDNNFPLGKVTACDDFINVIASLQQDQPEVDLKNEIITQWSKCNPTDEGMGSEYAIIAVEQFAAIARHFYELGLKARKEKSK